jgi:hypothetical protein
MDEKELQSSMDRLAEAWSKDSKAGMTLEAFKLASDLLVKFTRLVEAVECIAGSNECIASCHLDVADAAGAFLEEARPEGNC